MGSIITLLKYSWTTPFSQVKCHLVDKMKIYFSRGENRKYSFERRRNRWVDRNRFAKNRRRADPKSGNLSWSSSSGDSVRSSYLPALLLRKESGHVRCASRRESVHLARFEDRRRRPSATWRDKRLPYVGAAASWKTLHADGFRPKRTENLPRDQERRHQNGTQDSSRARLLRPRAASSQDHNYVSEYDLQNRTQQRKPRSGKRLNIILCLRELMGIKEYSNQLN